MRDYLLLVVVVSLLSFGCERLEEKFQSDEPLVSEVHFGESTKRNKTAAKSSKKRKHEVISKARQRRVKKTKSKKNRSANSIEIISNRDEPKQAPNEREANKRRDAKLKANREKALAKLKARETKERALERDKADLISTRAIDVDTAKRRDAKLKANQEKALAKLKARGKSKERALERDKADLISTIAIDVDTASYTRTRALLLQEGEFPMTHNVRTEEFVNYFAYDLTPPEDAPFALYAEAAPDPFSTNPTHDKILGVAIKAQQPKHTGRKPIHVTFAIDTSGSMFGEYKLDLITHSLPTMLEFLGPNDSIAITTFSSDANLILEPTSASEADVIIDAIRQVKAGGGTDLLGGIKHAYRVAKSHADLAHHNRVVLISDGIDNVSEDRRKRFRTPIQFGLRDGIHLSTYGVGAIAVNDKLMEQMSVWGGGEYHFIDGLAEAQHLFVDQLFGALQPVAFDVKLQVEFDDESVKTFALFGYKNKRLTREQFRDNSVDAGEIGAGHTVTALYRLVTKTERPKTLATVRVRYRLKADGPVREQTLQINDEDMRPALTLSSTDLQFATAVAVFAEYLSDAVPPKQLPLISELARDASENRPDRLQFLDIIQKALTLEQDLVEYGVEKRYGRIASNR